MLTTIELIERMTPTALAEVIASIGQVNLTDREAMTVDMLWGALVANVGEDEAAELLAAAR
jgi:hypothetical protein